MYKFLHGHVFSIFLGVYFGVELLGHMVTLCLTFKELPDCFPKWLYHFTLPPTMYEGSNSSNILTNTCYSHPSRCEVVSHCGFNLHSPND